jgi:hypothetical protein
VVNTIPTDMELFQVGGKPNAKYLRKHFQQEGKLTEAQTLRILNEGTALLRTEPNCLVADAPITSNFNLILPNSI